VPIEQGVKSLVIAAGNDRGAGVAMVEVGVLLVNRSKSKAISYETRAKPYIAAFHFPQFSLQTFAMPVRIFNSSYSTREHDGRVSTSK
jgi:hypothetical protein